MADPTTSASRRRWPRRLRRLVLLIALVGLIAVVRRQVLAREQEAFDERYGPGADRAQT